MKRGPASQIERLEWELDGRRAPVRVVVNPRARRLIVRVDAARREVVVTAPTARDAPRALRFAESRRDWIANALRDAPEPLPFAPGAAAPYLGEAHVIRHAPDQRRPVLRDPDAREISVGGDARHLARRLADWLRNEARAEISLRVERYAAALGRKPGRLSLRDPKSRWGSCGRNGDMSFSWRLIFAPPYVVDYVAAHECAHLVHMDHSPAFWALVAQLYGDPARAAAWMSENGARLHAYGAAASSDPAATRNDEIAH
ncbi:MAG: SprT family zinc-dependent metalloprotease [Parvularculaceae bacterium]